MSIITTFESQCRALTSASSSDENASRFLVGTQSLNIDNLLYLFEYKDDNNSLAKVSFKFPFGELWHLSTSSKYPNLVTGVIQNNNKLKISLFKLPQELENPIEDDYGLSESPIEKVFELIESDNKNLTKQCHWQPDSGEQLLICNNNIVEFWDIERQQKSSSFSLLQASKSHENEIEQGIDNHDKNYLKPSYITDLRWSSLFNCSVVAVAIGSKIYGIDTRIPDSSSSSICWLIEDNRCNRIRSIDFNPNSQYYLASGGDDCRANFWDLRQTAGPALHIQKHTHWIWSIRYNPFHDQLVLSAGSDARVALMRVQSIASEPFGQMIDYENDVEDNARDEEDEQIESAGDIHGDEKRFDKDETIDKKDDGFDRDSSNDKSNDKLDIDFDNGNHEIANNNNDRKTPKQRESNQLKDEVINVYEEHDDSVYAAEWATDPWIFASLGYESRLVINKVPKKEKFNILF